MADQIKDLDTKDLQIKVLAIVDNINIPKTTVYRCFDKYPLIMEYTNLPLPSDSNMVERRQRIANNMNRARVLVDTETDFVFLLEDDTDFGPEYLKKLIARYRPDRGIISGVQAGRHGIYHIGAWETDNISFPTVFETVPYRNKGLRQVDGTGLYCCLIATELFKRVPFPNETLPVGCDVQYGLELRRQGYKNYVDDTLTCGHVEQHRTILPSDECVQVSFRRIGDRWELKDGHKTLR